MQFLRVVHLSACLEAPSGFTNDHSHVPEASKDLVFIQKKLTFSIAMTEILQTFTRQMPLGITIIYLTVFFDLSRRCDCISYFYSAHHSIFCISFQLGQLVIPVFWHLFLPILFCVFWRHQRSPSNATSATKASSKLSLCLNKMGYGDTTHLMIV